jgi:hypothetical protein
MERVFHDFLEEQDARVLERSDPGLVRRDCLKSAAPEARRRIGVPSTVRQLGSNLILALMGVSPGFGM